MPPEPRRVAPITPAELTDRERFGWLYSPPRGKTVGFEYIEGDKFCLVVGELSYRKPPKYSTRKPYSIDVTFAKYEGRVLGDVLDNTSARIAPEGLLFRSHTPVHLSRDTFLEKVQTVKGIIKGTNEQIDYFEGIVEGERFAAD
ncbi:MAG: hypothetical protein HY362_03285 [Candidatus Aenigmarchaeota archaeon]|nr:hypothetical protein [Candidatus Aenigmarchaeota archaeon]